MFLHLCVVLFTCGVSVQGASGGGGSVQGRFLSRGFSFQGKGMSVQGGLFPGEGGLCPGGGGLCPGGGGLCPGGDFSVQGGEVSVQRGVSVWGCLSRGSLSGRVGGTHPTGMHFCLKIWLRGMHVN